MLKQSLIYFILSLVIILFSGYAKFVLVYIDKLYNLIEGLLTPIFTQGFAGAFLKSMVTLTLTPLVLSGIPALIYWGIKRKPMPYFLPLTWLFWLVLAIDIYLG